MLSEYYFREIWTKKDIENLIINEVEENIHLEYKSCAALLKEYEIIDRGGNRRIKTKPTDSIKREVSKDISAFANADGGTIIYGIIERGHKPELLDAGFIPYFISKEWLEQVINANIQRRIDDVHIHPVDIGDNHFLYVVEVPKSPIAPHMAKDNRYYKRYNFQVLPMSEYEVREAMNRNFCPILKMHDPQVSFNQDDSFSVIFKIKNHGNAVAKYFDIILHFDKGIEFEITKEEWEDLSGGKPRTKLGWSYKKVIHPDLRISIPPIKFIKIPGKILHLTANLYAERMNMETYVCNIDIRDINNPIVDVKKKPKNPAKS